MKLVQLLLVCLLAYRVSGYAVFAHFMVTNSENYTLADWEEDISLALDASIDAFALNMAYEDSTNDKALPLAFEAAANVEGDFGLFFSFDYSGNGAWPKAVVAEMILEYSSYSAYYLHNSKPFVSTFEGPANAEDWKTIKEETDCFFAALEVGGGGIVDALFSWAAWPWGPRDMDTYTDASYLQYLNESGQALPYMMPVSPWFYTNLPGYEKNWLWRGDHIWHDRWLEAWYIRPEFIEIISWNDYGESHYIGPLRDNAMAAFEIGEAAYNYVTGMPHDGWRDLLPYVADTYKDDIATIATETLVAWYRLQPVAACGTGGTSANTASELQLEFTPAEVLTDMIFFSALLADTADVSVTVGGVSIDATWRNIPNEKGPQTGLYHGQAAFGSNTGEVVVTVSRDGSTIAQVVGEAISTSCTDGLANYNAWVGSAKASTAVNAVTPALLEDQVCVNGTGPNNFAGLCGFACTYGYCPLLVFFIFLLNFDLEQYH
ncbi:putative extracellular alpha-1,3-glucanase/mutanase [Aspergillus heteromorphus CBS 117.55]|uniref:Putative extracellular alpha-1,3-glucanase/mutanase n=1 Tax=Aspergillus heteromorphus CBS 117.55 TaxID=1448321 RepID=A0A317WCG1_9EURO|nr:putative extracellular alpha-1,3-glucanase/mutanase [Aspergillus heteromorphus CBS 117.55]PWY83615.1 putative extracellular alpha-1,3-glucanase/mutanase [Aspergillus heteromorphus CBS 117.55]